MRAGALAICALALAACAADDPAVLAERNWQRCAARGEIAQRLRACSAVIAAEDEAASRRVEALVNRGRARMGLGHHTRAIADFGRALRLDPANAEALFQRGMAHYERSAFAIAARDFDAALRLDPRHDYAARWRDEANQSLVLLYDDNLRELGALIAEAPDDSALLNNRCWLRVTHGRELEAALADCNEAVRLNPAGENALDSRGLVHYRLGRFDAALADYDAALAIDPERGHYMFGRALALHALGRADEARAAFAAAEAAEPGVGALYAGYGAPGPL